MKRLIAPVVVLAVAGLLAGCGKTLDGASIEGQIADGIGNQAGGTWTVSCPDSVDAKLGGTFTCEAKSEDGQTVTVDVTQDDDQGNVTWSVGGGTDASPAAG